MLLAKRAIPISALQHYLFCPRQCALIHNEQVWADNQYTAEGQVLHAKANEGPDEHRSNGKVLRHLHIKSDFYNITGICDIVEISNKSVVTPVEYKRGKPKSHRADEVQLCAQALCLENMFDTDIDQGLIFYGKTRRRTSIAIDEELRELTLQAINATSNMFVSGHTPTAQYSKTKCSNCSLIDLCVPHSMRLKKGAKSWFTSQLSHNLEDHPNSL